MSTVLFAGGGSLGHIVPSLAVWEALQDAEKNLKAHFVCSTSILDTEYLKREGVPFSAIHAPRFSISFLWKFWKAAKEARDVIDAVQPDVVFSKGGYVSVPICYIAKKRKIPIILHESDAVMGRANRLVAELATTTCSGTPVRKRVTSGSREAGYALTGFTAEKPVLLVIGGSQGAQALNEAVTNQLDELLQTYQIVHLTGHGKQHVELKPGYYAVEFASEELPHFYAIADLAISRAGAGATAELAANGIPTVLVPLRGVGHDHQQKNAERLAQQPLFKVLQQSELSDKLTQALEEMSNITDQSADATEQADNDAVKAAKIVLQVLDSSHRPH